MPTSADRYVHEPLDQEVTAIAGHYVLVREERLPFLGRELLYVLGHAVFDTSCCGVGGCGYAIVPGFVVRWHAGCDDEGKPFSAVEPILDEDHRAQITQLIREREGIHQVQFQG